MRAAIAGQWCRGERIADGARKCPGAHVGRDLQHGRSLDDVWHEFCLFHADSSWTWYRNLTTFSALNRSSRPAFDRLRLVATLFGAYSALHVASCMRLCLPC